MFIYIALLKEIECLYEKEKAIPLLFPLIKKGKSL